MSIIDVVKWEGAPNVFAFKFPDSELNTKAQLIVRESQEAVFVQEGKFYGPFGAGRHTMDTKNLPFLSAISNKLIFGGSSPFTAEVWFVQKAIPLNILWGTTDPVMVEDPLYHIILPVRAFGQYGVKIVNSMKFLAKLVGQLPAFTEMTLSPYLRGIIVTQVKTCLGEMLVEKQVCLLKIAGKLSEISLSLQERISAALEDYGLQVVSFQVNSISVSETDPSVKKLKEALAKKAEMNILGYTYQQERSFDTMQTAAGNSGAGGAAINAGIGLGMGVGFAAPMGNMASAIGQNITQSPQQVLCWKCGKPRPVDSAFCTSCGAPAKAPAAEGIVCPKCGAHLAAATKFCGSCGAKLEMVCPSCKKPTTPGASFCQECGASLK